MVSIIAEIGINWDGDFELVSKMIKKSKLAGCDLVKFQSFNEKIVENHPEKKRLMNSSITSENIEKIDKISKDIGIEWFCTPMYPEAVELIDPYVNRFKIREKDARNLQENEINPILKEVLKKNKEIMISSEKFPEKSKLVKNKKIRWLYCVPKYPCMIEEVDFKNIKKFDGYSNHCSESIIPITAITLGSDILEIHVTSDKSKKFIDNPVSFDFTELTKLIKQIRMLEKIKR
jgi:N,N'-diacetyllegionaminate synthase